MIMALRQLKCLCQVLPPLTGIPFCLKPRELMAAGGWLNGTAAEDVYTCFWNERFLVTVPEELVAIVFPHLAQLEQVSVPLLPGEGAAILFHCLCIAHLVCL